MSQFDWNSLEHMALYEIPIETLGLSEKAIKAAKRLGVTSIGDCVDHFVRITSGIAGSAPHEFFEAMETEVKPQLETHGYWSRDASDTD